MRYFDFSLARILLDEPLNYSQMKQSGFYRGVALLFVVFILADILISPPCNEQFELLGIPLVNVEESRAEPAGHCEDVCSIAPCTARGMNEIELEAFLIATRRLATMWNRITGWGPTLRT
jgi:hypothetical protein